MTPLEQATKALLLAQTEAREAKKRWSQRKRELTQLAVSRLKELLKKYRTPIPARIRISFRGGITAGSTVEYVDIAINGISLFYWMNSDRCQRILGLPSGLPTDKWVTLLAQTVAADYPKEILKKAGA